MKIIISNDDGLDSLGIQELFRALKNAGHDVIMLAPDQERSTVSHALTLYKPLRMIEMAEDQYALTGTPADCIHIALRHKWRFKPELVISGINRGANLGSDTHYSGTVSCAREAVLHGLPALAVSLVLQHDMTELERKALQAGQHYNAAASLVVEILPKIQDLEKFKNRLLNLNVPNLSYENIKGVKLAFLGDRSYEGDLIYRNDPRGKPYLWIGGNYSGYTPIEGSDNNFISQGYASITPINLDNTDYSLMKEMETWGVQQEF